MNGTRKAALLAGTALLVAPAIFMLVFWPGHRAATPPGSGPVAGSASVPVPAPRRPSGVRAVPGTPRATPSDPVAAAAADDAAGYLTELGAIDPTLVSDRDGALDAGESTCHELAAGTPYDSVVRDAANRFRAAQPKATLIVDAARNHLCPG